MTSRDVPAGGSSLQTFEDVYRRELTGVLALAYALSGSRWAAEELAQDADGRQRQDGRQG